MDDIEVVYKYYFFYDVCFVLEVDKDLEIVLKFDDGYVEVFEYCKYFNVVRYLYRLS